MDGDTMLTTQKKSDSIATLTLGNLVSLVLVFVAALIINKGGYRIDTAISRAQELVLKVLARGLRGAPEGGWDERAYQSPNRSEQSGVGESASEDFNSGEAFYD